MSRRLELTNFDFNPFGTESIILKFDCDACGEPIESEEISVPSPNYGADRASDSQVEEEGYAVCDKCNKEFEIDIFVTYAGASGNINNLPDDYYVSVEELANSEDDLCYDERFDLQLLTRDEPLDKLKERLQHAQRVLTLEGDVTAKKLAVNLVFSSAITAFEAFLWETVDYCVEHEEESFRNIVTKIPALKDQPMKLGEIFKKNDTLKEHVKGYLQNLVWHRWDKVSPLFKLGLSIQPPSFKPFDDALIKRHDIVHRSGHDKSGNPISVTPDEIRELCLKIETFAAEIDTKLAMRKVENEGE
jgi:hypothetical protein